MYLRRVSFVLLWENKRGAIPHAQFTLPRESAGTGSSFWLFFSLGGYEAGFGKFPVRALGNLGGALPGAHAHTAGEVRPAYIVMGKARQGPQPS